LAFDIKRVVLPDERLPAAAAIPMGVQHQLTMSGSTIVAPLLMGFDPNVAVFFSGIGTLLFFVLTAGRVPSYLGSSFAFIAVVIAATGYGGSGPNPNIAIALGGIIACGALYALIGLVVMAIGTGLGGAAHAAGRHRRDRCFHRLNLAPRRCRPVEGERHAYHPSRCLRFSAWE
jgi:xanthine/uracil permease